MSANMQKMQNLRTPGRRRLRGCRCRRRRGENNRRGMHPRRRSSAANCVEADYRSGAFGHDQYTPAATCGTLTAQSGPPGHIASDDRARSLRTHPLLRSVRLSEGSLGECTRVRRPLPCRRRLAASNGTSAGVINNELSIQQKLRASWFKQTEQPYCKPLSRCVLSWRLSRITSGFGIYSAHLTGSRVGGDSIKRTVNGE